MNECMNKAILIQTKLSKWSEWRFGFMPFVLNGSFNWGWIGLMYSTGWHRKDTQKQQDRILGLTKSAWCNGGNLPDLHFKHVDFTPHFIYWLVLQVWMKAYCWSRSMLDPQDISMSGSYSQKSLIKWKRQRSKQFTQIQCDSCYNGDLFQALWEQKSKQAQQLSRLE